MIASILFDILEIVNLSRQRSGWKPSAGGGNMFATFILQTAAQPSQEISVKAEGDLDSSLSPDLSALFLGVER